MAEKRTKKLAKRRKPLVQAARRSGERPVTREDMEIAMKSRRSKFTPHS